MSYGSNFGLGIERKKRLPHSGSQVSMLTPVTFLIAETAQNPSFLQFGGVFFETQVIST